MSIDVSAFSADDSNYPLHDTSVDAYVNSITAWKPYYALPSGHACVCINEDYGVIATFDSGSEVNLMPHRIYTNCHKVAPKPNLH